MEEARHSARVVISVRLRPASIEQLDRMAASEGVERATLIRTLLSEAVIQRTKGKR